MYPSKHFTLLIFFVWFHKEHPWNFSNAQKVFLKCKKVLEIIKMFFTLKKEVILRKVHRKAFYGSQNVFLWYRWPSFGTFIFKSALNCRSAPMCLHLQWCCCECWRHGENLFLFLTVSLSSQCALDRQKWAAGWGSSGRRKTTVRERFTPPSSDRRWRPRSGWTTRTTTWTSWWGKTVSCQLFSYLRWIHSDIKWLLKEMISRVRNVEVRIICEELLKGEIKPWHTEILQQRSLILCCSANPRSDDTCKWQTPNPPRILSVNHSSLVILQHTLHDRLYLALRQSTCSCEETLRCLWSVRRLPVRCWSPRAVRWLMGEDPEGLS